MADVLEIWKSSLAEAQKILSEFLSNPDQMRKCELFTQKIVETYRNNGNIFICGNGGSHCDAMHFAEELTGKYRLERRPLGALALGDPSHVTCVGNDYGFEHVFSRQLAALARRGDLLIGLSTSGNSKNVGLAFETAQERGIRTVALLGRDGGWLKEKAEHVIIVPAKTSDRVQEMHIKILHTVIEAAEWELFPASF
ncbi:MAG: SIS domain-containing protein [Deltaproteobacteria bacterium]